MSGTYMAYMAFAGGGGAKYAPYTLGIRPYIPGYTAQTAHEYLVYSWKTSRWVKPHAHKGVKKWGTKGNLYVYPLF